MGRTTSIQWCEQFSNGLDWYDPENLHETNGELSLLLYELMKQEFHKVWLQKLLVVVFWQIPDSFPSFKLIKKGITTFPYVNLVLLLIICRRLKTRLNCIVVNFWPLNLLFWWRSSSRCWYQILRSTHITWGLCILPKTGCMPSNPENTPPHPSLHGNNFD